MKPILQDLHLRESRIATVVKEVKVIMVLIIVAVESGEDIIFGCRPDFMLLKKISRGCQPTPQQRAGLVTLRKKLSGGVFLSCWIFCLSC